MISDMIIRIKNAQRAGKASVEMPYSKAKFELAKILENEKFVGSLEEKGRKAAKKLSINLIYNEGVPAISDIVRKSKPSRRVYIGKNDTHNIRQGFGRAIISTSRGLMTGAQARKAGLGGELICELY